MKSQYTSIVGPHHFSCSPIATRLVKYDYRQKNGGFDLRPRWCWDGLIWLCGEVAVGLGLTGRLAGSVAGTLCWWFGYDMCNQVHAGFTVSCEDICSSLRSQWCFAWRTLDFDDIQLNIENGVVAS